MTAEEQKINVQAHIIRPSSIFNLNWDSESNCSSNHIWVQFNGCLNSPLWLIWNHICYICISHQDGHFHCAFWEPVWEPRSEAHIWKERGRQMLITGISFAPLLMLSITSPTHTNAKLAVMLSLKEWLCEWKRCNDGHCRGVWGEGNSLSDGNGSTPDEVTSNFISKGHNHQLILMPRSVGMFDRRLHMIIEFSTPKNQE